MITLYQWAKCRTHYAKPTVEDRQFFPSPKAHLAKEAGNKRKKKKLYPGLIYLWVGARVGSRKHRRYVNSSFEALASFLWACSLSPKVSTATGRKGA